MFASLVLVSLLMQPDYGTGQGLIMSPNPVTDEEVDLYYKDYSVREGIRRAAIDLEIRSQNEYVMGEYYFRLREDSDFKKMVFRNHLETLKDRYQTIKDAPRLSDLHMFPQDTMELYDLIVFSGGHIEWLRGQCNLNKDRENFYNEVIQENENLRNIYFALYNAKQKFGSPVEIRQNLKVLKKKVGDDIYYGRKPFPPPVAIWRFAEVEN